MLIFPGQKKYLNKLKKQKTKKNGKTSLSRRPIPGAPKTSLFFNKVFTRKNPSCFSKGLNKNSSTTSMILYSKALSLKDPPWVRFSIAKPKRTQKQHFYRKQLWEVGAFQGVQTVSSFPHTRKKHQTIETKWSRFCFSSFSQTNEGQKPSTKLQKMVKVVVKKHQKTTAVVIKWVFFKIFHRTNKCFF